MSILARLVTGILHGGGAASRRRAAAAACAEAVKRLKQGQASLAQEGFARALSQDPRHFAALSGLGVLHHRLGHRSLALDLLLRALEVEPRSREIALLAAQLLRLAKRRQEALAVLAPVLDASPDDPTVGYEMARLQRETGDMDGARRRLQALLERVPNHLGILEELAIVYRDCGEVAPAIECYERLAALMPDRARGGSARLFQELYRNEERKVLLGLHARWAERFAPAALQRSGHANDPAPERILRIGYVSADFGLTSAAPFIEPLLAHCDRARFAVTCYHASAHDDEVTARMRAYGHDWRDIADLDDEAFCAMVRSDRIDILVDLNGHTRGGRLTAFARRPAPVQATYLGYGATTGVAAIDYRITDAYIDPVGECERCYTETLLRLPGTMWCFAPPRATPAVQKPPFVERGAITFGSFNNFAKVGPEVLDTWATIGAQASGARFLFVGVPAGEIRRRVVERFGHRGVQEDRLTFNARVAPGDYYALYHEADVALDTFPYNGGATTCDALWMGVPVLTLAGRGTLARSGLSLLTAVGLRDWVAESIDDYVAGARAVAQSPEALGELRAGLRDRISASSLCDARRFMAGLEDALRRMWRTWCETKKEGLLQ